MSPPGARPPGARRAPIQRGVLAVIGFYSRAISPALPPRCRFYPTCSAYAAEAVEVHGAGRGTWLALRRLAKCAPWHPGGVDHVPDGTHGPAIRGRAPELLIDIPADDAAAPGEQSTHRATPPVSRRATMEESSLA